MREKPTAGCSTHFCTPSLASEQWTGNITLLVIHVSPRSLVNTNTILLLYFILFPNISSTQFPLPSGSILPSVSIHQPSLATYLAPRLTVLAAWHFVHRMLTGWPLIPPPPSPGLQAISRAITEPIEEGTRRKEGTEMGGFPSVFHSVFSPPSSYFVFPSTMYPLTDSFLSFLSNLLTTFFMRSTWMRSLSVLFSVPAVTYVLILFLCILAFLLSSIAVIPTTRPQFVTCRTVCSLYIFIIYDTESCTPLLHSLL